MQIPRDGLGDYTNYSESELCKEVRHTVSVQHMLYGLCGYSTGAVMPACVRVKSKRIFIPAGAKYEIEHDMDGNDSYLFNWFDRSVEPAEYKKAVLRIMDGSDCEVMEPVFPYK
jgi:hypothetical protein